MKKKGWDTNLVHTYNWDGKQVAKFVKLCPKWPENLCTFGCFSKWILHTKEGSNGIDDHKLNGSSIQQHRQAMCYDVP